MYSIGIDLGGTLTKVALVAPDGEILAGQRLPTRAGRSAEETFAELAAAIRKMVSEAGLPYPPPGGCGLGIPASLEYPSGRIRISGPFDWTGINPGQVASAALDCEVLVDTDVNAGSLADLYFGCAREASEVIYIAWGTGIGAGFIFGRKLYHSRGGAMCNFGHAPADVSSNRLCYCGCRGCLEIEAGGKAMTEKVRERLAAGEASALRPWEDKMTPERISWAAGRGDTLACEILERSAVLMARALAGLLACLNPDTVVFAGGVSRCFPVIQEVFDRELRLRTPNFSLPLTRITQSSFGPDAGVIGAAMLPRERKSR